MGRVSVIVMLTSPLSVPSSGGLTLHQGLNYRHWPGCGCLGGVQAQVFHKRRGPMTQPGHSSESCLVFCFSRYIQGSGFTDNDYNPGSVNLLLPALPTDEDSLCTLVLTPLCFSCDPKPL